MPLVRRITGTANGQYTFSSITPNGCSLALQGVTTTAGQVDVLSMNPDLTQLNFIPGSAMTFNMTIARQVGDQSRVITIRGVGGGPADNIAITTSSDLQFARLSNPGIRRNVEVEILAFEPGQNVRNRRLAAANLAPNSELKVEVHNWATLDTNLQTLQIP
jgi:hypothetical protein